MFCFATTKYSAGKFIGLYRPKGTWCRKKAVPDPFSETAIFIKIVPIT
jgi:hypothetical protein